MTSTIVNTIGFTKTDAERFFGRLKSAGVKKVVDVRLHNTSQLAGFAKAEDLKYFLSVIVGIEYIHKPLLAPTDEMLKTFKKEKGAWSDYETQFLSLMSARKIEDKLTPAMLADTCLLCSEATPHHCHRRLVVEYLNQRWGGQLEVRHL